MAATSIKKISHKEQSFSLVEQSNEDLCQESAPKSTNLNCVLSKVRSNQKERKYNRISLNYGISSHRTLASYNMSLSPSSRQLNNKTLILTKKKTNKKIIN